ncbi:hypothetical protein HY605_02255 [Candidatus Peregrinibacteria bacterium]|nr:hypothetical protein [Candidatus Peregrinibacteria bacterium]
MRCILWILVTPFLFNYAYSQSKDDISLQFKFKEGEALKYVMTVSSQTDTKGVKANMEQAYTIIETIERVDDKGIVTIKLKYESVKHKLTAPMKNITFDSSRESDIKKAKDNSSISMLANMVGKEVTIKVKDSEVIDVDLKAIKEALQGESAKDGKVAFIDNSIRNFTSNFLPQKPIKRGDTWGEQVMTFLPTFGAISEPFLKINAKPHYKLEEIISKGDKVAKIGLSAGLNVEKAEEFDDTEEKYYDDKRNGEANGTILFSLTKGRLLKSSITQTFTVDTEPPIGQMFVGKAIKSKTTQKIEVELK